MKGRVANIGISAAVSSVLVLAAMQGARQIRKS